MHRSLRCDALPMITLILQKPNMSCRGRALARLSASDYRHGPVVTDNPGMIRFATGDLVQTPLGKGIICEVRKNGRLLVEIKGRALVIDEGSVAPLDAGRPKQRSKKVRDHESTSGHATPLRRQVAAEVDLHGLTVEEALVRAAQALNDAMLADLPELRLIHGRSSGRIKAALHRQLGTIRTVRSVRVDPRNAGVTIVAL
jgi:DNA mismatch repair protein MutS2